MLEKKDWWIIGAVGVFALFVVLLYVGPKIGLPFFSVTSTGFSTLALSNIGTTSNDPNLAGQVWFLTVSQNGAGQSAYASQGTTIKNDQTGATSNPITISIDLTQNYATYPIFNQGVPIQHISYTTVSYKPFTANKGCPSSYSNYISYGAVPYVSTVYCYNFVTDGYYGTIGPADQHFTSTINVQGSGGSDSCTISNTGANSCYSRSGNVYASWEGSLISGASPPSPTDQGIDAIYDTSTNGWKTSSSVNYNQYKNAIDNFQTCLNSIPVGFTTTNADSCFISVNSPEQGVMAGFPFTTSGGVSATTSGSQSSGQIMINLPQQFSFPLITLKIKAALVGINIPVGQPKILSALTQTFQTGTQGNVAVTVENVGSASGSFNVGITCSGTQFSQQGVSQTISGLAPKAQQTINLPVTANVLSGTAKGSCTVTATDMNNPSNKATYSVTLSASALFICTNGKIETNGNLIQQCQNNAWVTIKTCPANETATLTSSGQGQCVPIKIAGGGEGLFAAIKNFVYTFIISKIKNFFTILKWIEIILGALFALLFSKEVVGRIAKTIPTAVQWIVSGIVAFLVGLLISQVWWIALLSLVAFIIIKIVMKAK